MKDLVLNAIWVLVEVTRGKAEKISAEFYAHEVPCLAEMHGASNIRMITNFDKDILSYKKIGKKDKLDPLVEWSRLEAKYGMHPSTNMQTVAVAYHGEMDNMINFDLAAYLRKIGKEEAKPDHVDANDNGTITVEELKAKLDELGIEYKANDRKESLSDTLSLGMMEMLDKAGIDYEEDAHVEVLYAQVKTVVAMAKRMADTQASTDAGSGD